MKVIALSLACLAAVAAECALLRPFGLSIARAEVHVAVILFFALRCHTLEGALGSFAAGYFIDVLSGQPSGLYVFTAVLTFLLARFVAPFVDVRTAKGFAPLAAAIDVMHGLIVWGLVSLVTPAEQSRDAMLGSVLATAGLTAIAALLIWPVLRSIENFFRKPETGLLL